MKTPFLGGAYESRSLNLACQQCINLYPEVVETKQGKDVGMLVGSPGLDLMFQCGAGPIRNVHVMNGKLYVVSGNELYSVSVATTYSVSAALGTLSTSSGWVSMVDNGTQLGVFDGTHGYCWNGTTFTTLTLSGSNPVSAAYQDGFALVNQSGSDKIWQSNVFDMTTWQALAFGEASGTPDFVVAMGMLHREIWVFKQTTTEVWQNAGTSPFAFSRLDGVFVETGCASPGSVVKVGESLIWLAQDDRGRGMVMMTKGFTPARVSTHAIEKSINSVVNLSNAVAYSYQQEGHVFYVLTLPDGDVTWVFDVTTQLWHQRAAFDASGFHRHWGCCGITFNGLPLIGDYRNGNIYAYNLNRYDDNGTRRKWLRSWRALPQSQKIPLRFNGLVIDMQTGLNVPAGSDPQVMLRWTDDGGHTYSNYMNSAAGKTGKTAKNVKFTRIGSTRAATGLDRVFELSSSDPFPVALIGAELT